MSLYKSVEKNFFNTLTKKITGNVLFLLLPHIILLIIGYIHFNKLETSLASAGQGEISIEAFKAHLDSFWLYGTATVSFALISGIFTIFFMRHLFLKPINAMTDVLKAIKDKDGDISATLPEYTYDEISEMAESYNAFSASLKGMIAESRRRSVSVALSSTRLQKVLIEAQQSANTQEEQAQKVFQSSQEATQAIDNIAGSTLEISERNSKNLDEIRTSSSELGRVQNQVEAIRHQVTDFQETVHQLESNSRNITEILGMVKDFSDQTNLLALNASIEAARAGEAGRGFSVVADEVRNLSQKVSTATSEIDQNISQMSSLVGSTRTSAATILEYVGSTEEFIGSTNDQFHGLVSDFEELNSQLSSISAAIDELAYTNRESHNHVSEITNISTSMHGEIEQSRHFSEELEHSTEETQELLSRFIIGYGGFEGMIQTGRQWAQQVQGTLESLSSRGCNLFDTNYVRTNDGQIPEKYDTSYVDQYDALLRPIFDSFISERSEFIYAIAVDRNGYAPAHHTKVSERITGNFDIDNAKSRNRRIFAGNRAEIRRASSTAPFLLQTFIRDTGEILNDLAIPLYVNGQHWGALIMGFAPENLLDDKS
ncbi:methyl-accepting chemotaxis protein [uncultured Neptuniibacter sp.]|uniref:methyl-accepting chemotaxis protein n=1 Tax=uncultured Neptuniibacter sp. TaxID=502143 RepID=UPI0026394FFF|nr:methyl-accepting chemotaxis protein [uncultured Neptuniibacter sp.]